jgi:disulfide bond formation protein DsbB
VTLRRIARARRLATMPAMTALTNLVSGWRWPVLALAASALMLAAAHAFERFGGLPPCPLCLRQREVYWALIFMTATGLAIWRVVPKRRFIVALNVMIGLVFVVGVVVAFYHAGVEWQVFPPPTGCSAGGSNPLDLGDLNTGLDQPFKIASCTAAPFYILGLSMAGWNGVISALLAAASFAAAGLTVRSYRLR